MTADAEKKPMCNPSQMYCPSCLARPGDPCEDVVSGWITARPTPHNLRVRAAEEVYADGPGRLA